MVLQSLRRRLRPSDRYYAARAAVWRTLASRPLQPFWRRVHHWSLEGMNIGGGTSVRDSGELWLLRRLRASRDDQPAVVLDVGANVGDYAEAAADALGPAARVHSFEPSPAAFRRLSERLGGRANVKLHPFGLSDRAASAPLYATMPGGGLGSLYPRDLSRFGLEVKKVEEVVLRPAMEVLQEEGITRARLLKLDVEGHELPILRACRELWANGGVDVLQFEFGGCNLDSRTYLRDFYDLLSPVFEFHRLLPRGLAPIPAYDERMEIFTTTNFVCVRRGLRLA